MEESMYLLVNLLMDLILVEAVVQVMVPTLQEQEQMVGLQVAVAGERHWMVEMVLLAAAAAAAALQ